MSAQKKEPPVMVYIPLVGGAPIVAMELRRTNGHILVKHPAHAQMNQEQTQYVFSPFMFIDQDHRLYESGLIADGPAPAHVLADYKSWVATREATQSARS